MKLAKHHIRTVPTVRGRTVTDDTGRVWPIPAGGAGDDEDSDDEDSDEDGDDEDGTDWKSEARKWEKRAKDNSDAATKLKQLEDKDKTETQKLRDDLATATGRADKAEHGLLRMQVALDQAPTDMPLTKVRSLAKRLSGDDEDALKADASELFADFTSPGDDADDDDKSGGDPKGTPKPKLKPGTGGDADGATPDADKIADKVMSSGF